MSSEKHTEGPWRYQEKSDAYTHIVRAGENRFICQLPQDTSGRAEADARLIAAAPELLEVAKRCLMIIDDGSLPNWDWVRSVVAKATVRP